LIDYGVIVTPALVIDGDVKVAGKIPSKKEINEWIEEKKIKKNDTEVDKNIECSIPC